MKGKRHYEYVTQDSYKGGEWQDHQTHRKIADAMKMLSQMRADPNWTDSGNRQWRLVRRCITETILAN